MALPSLQTRLKQLDSFVIEAGSNVCSTGLNGRVDDGTATAEIVIAQIGRLI